jgi:hypothetical protein
MRRIGTVSSATGFIFLGVWMILRQVNTAMADEMFKWWPIIIIILGCEVLVGFNKRDEYQRVGLNVIIIPVILVFIGVNIFTEVKKNVASGIDWFQKSGNIDSVLDKLSDFNYGDYKTIDTKKEFNAEGKEVIFDTDNGDITVKNSTSNKITVEATIYVKKDSEQSKYDIAEKKEVNGYKIVIDENYVKKVKAVIYIPQDMNIVIKGNNSKIVSDDNRTGSSFIIETNNGSLDIKSALSIKAKINNAKIDIKDTETVDINSNNGTVNINGKAPNINIDINNGVINVENEICNNVNIKANSGTVKLDTEHKDIDVELQLDHGTSKLNDERRVNSGLSKIFGNGTGKAKIDVSNGLITFTN